MIKHPTNKLERIKAAQAHAKDKKQHDGSAKWRRDEIKQKEADNALREVEATLPESVGDIP